MSLLQAGGLVLTVSAVSCSAQFEQAQRLAESLGGDPGLVMLQEVSALTVLPQRVTVVCKRGVDVRLFFDVEQCIIVDLDDSEQLTLLHIQNKRDIAFTLAIPAGIGRLGWLERLRPGNARLRIPVRHIPPGVWYLEKL